MKVVAIIQARMGSTRLPGKVLMNVCGSTMLELVVRRTQQSKLLDKVVVATTTSIADNVLIAECKRLNVPFFRGEEQDVLDRYYRTALASWADVIVRITSDCPLIDPRVVDIIIKAHLDSKSDYTTGSFEDSFPRGLDTEVFQFDALEKAYKEAKSNYEREHVTPYIYQHPNLFKLEFVRAEGRLRRPDIRLTVDTEEDLLLIREIFSILYCYGNTFSIEDVLAVMDDHPHLQSINAHIVQKDIPSS